MDQRANKLHLWRDIWAPASLFNLAEKRRGTAELFGVDHLNVVMKRDLEFYCDTARIDHESTYPYCDNFFRTQPGVRDHITNDHIYKWLLDVAPMTLELLRIGDGNISICGGAIQEILFQHLEINVSRCIRTINDYDFFFHPCAEGSSESSNIEKADSILKQCLSYLDPLDSECSYRRNQGSITYKSHVDIQFIKRLYQSKDRVLLGFDMPGCQYGYNLVDGLFMTMGGLLSLMTQHYPVDMTQRTKSHDSRLFKYVGKGFKILLPGLDDINATFENGRCKFDTFIDGKHTMTLKKKEQRESDYEEHVSSTDTLMNNPCMFNFFSKTSSVS